VLQESLTNVHRHSGSAIANLRLFMDDGNAVLEIEDQGKGFPAHLTGQTEVLSSTGVGLRGMIERMRQLGGNLELSSTAKGSIVRASIPTQIPAQN